MPSQGIDSGSWKQKFGRLLVYVSKEGTPGMKAAIDEAEGRDRDKNRETAAIAGVFMADRTATIDHVGLRVPPQPDLCDLSET
jgi:hypothetical protein